MNPNVGKQTKDRDDHNQNDVISYFYKEKKRKKEIKNIRTKF